MDQHSDPERHYVRDAIFTFAAVVLAVAALDDITTDRDLSFTFERSMLAVCAAWFLVVGWQLRQQGHRVIGATSIGLVTIAALAQPLIGQGAQPTLAGYLAYFATIGALAWFLVVAGILAGLAFRLNRHHAA